MTVGSYSFARLIDASAGANDILRLNQSISAADRSVLRGQGFEQIFAINRAPVLNVTLKDATMPEDGTLSFGLPAGAFSDADGDVLTYSARLAGGGNLPSWIRFDAETRSFTAEPPANYHGTIEIEVLASDGGAERIRAPDAYDYLRA